MTKLSQRMEQKKCPYIQRIYDCFRTQLNIYMILQFCGEGDLESLLMENKKFSQQQGTQIIYQVARSLQFLGQSGIAHRDIKPQNVFLKKLNNKMYYKLGDFGFASQKNTFSTTLGTYPYMAPQLFEYNNYDMGVDIWALGVMSHQILFGQVYYMGKDQWQIKKKVLSANYELKQGQKNRISKQMQDFISKCLIKDPKKRIKSDQLCKHKVFQKVIKQQAAQLDIKKDNKIDEIFNYIMNLIRQYINKCIFLTKVAKSLYQLKRSTTFAIVYLYKRSYFNLSLLYQSIMKGLNPFQVNDQFWNQFAKFQKFGQVKTYVQYFQTDISQQYNRIIQFFNDYCNKFDNQQRKKINLVVNPSKSVDIQNEIYVRQLMQWRNILQNDYLEENRKLSLELLLATKINQISSYNFTNHVQNRDNISQQIIKQGIFKL